MTVSLVVASPPVLKTTSTITKKNKMTYSHFIINMNKAVITSLYREHTFVKLWIYYSIIVYLMASKTLHFGKYMTSLSPFWNIL